MIKINVKKIICLMLVSIFLISTYAAAFQNRDKTSTYVSEDIDPLVDLNVTVTIKEIRALDKIDWLGNPDFYVKVFINDVEHTSHVWHNQEYVTEEWSTIPTDVPDDAENVDIKIQLWDKNIGPDQMCDISKDYTLFGESRDVELIYNIKTGHWYGDDAVQHYLDWDAQGDPSGYGRLNGCDDNSIYENDLDCELWFEITQNDYDGDGIPYWTEVNVYGTDPEACDLGRDDDCDGVPIEWEHKWGYDPFAWDNHSSLDPDEDGLDNIEEYKASKEGFYTDPFRKDILLEIDQMKIGPNGEGNALPELSKDLLRDAFSRHNIVFQIDDQGQVIPFDHNTSGWHGPELQNIYFNYFLNGNESYWRRGAFHYAPILYKADDHPGFMWASIVGNRSDPRNCSVYGDCFQVSTKRHDNVQYWGPISWIYYPLFYRIVHRTRDKEEQRAIIYASAMMHETGHVLGIFRDNVPGCDNSNAVFPWQKEWWVWRSYKSCMNYGWMYQLVDYSDGSHGKNDFDDWSNIDLTLFQKERDWYR